MGEYESSWRDVRVKRFLIQDAVLKLKPCEFSNPQVLSQVRIKPNVISVSELIRFIAPNIAATGPDA